MNIKETLKAMTLEEKAGMCSGLDFWHFKGVERLGIPALMVCDGPHGLRKQEDGANADMLGINDSITAVCFPTASALAASFDRELLNQVGETLGRECQAVDIAVLLGPGNNIKRSPLCGRNFEYFSEDPYLASEMAAAHIGGVQSQGVGTSMKHYCANNQETRRMSASSNMDERTLREIYLAAFEGAVKKGRPKTIMCSYNRINGIFASENGKILTDILRDEWGFDGIVITDWGAGKDRVKGIEAGLNIEMPGGSGLSDARIVEAVKAGTLEEAKLDNIVEQILRLIDWVTEHKQEGVAFDYEADHRKAVEAAAECAVLLKNEDAILPLQKGKKLAFIGEFAEKPRYQGSGSSHIKSWRVDSVLEALGVEGSSGGQGENCDLGASEARDAESLQEKRIISYAKGYIAKENATDNGLLAEAVRAAEEAEAAVIFAGLPDAFESEGFDRKHLRLPDNQVELIRAVAAVQKNTVVVLHNGAPVEMPWISEVKAVLEMYLAGEGVGRAEAALLFGEANPSGKLAETFPLKLAHNPSALNFPGSGDAVDYREGIFVGYRYYDRKELDVLFPFGHGLSYTDFAYSDLALSAASMTDREEITVSCRVKNTGSRKGKEVVQLYVGPADMAARKVSMAVRALKGFEKLSLDPGEEREVRFVLDKTAFAYYSETLGDWHVETGDYCISLGASSRDIRLTGNVHVESTVEVPVHVTPYTAIADIMSTTKGKAILGQMMPAKESMMPVPEEDDNPLGEGSQEMMQAMAAEVPLAALVSFGVMSNEQMEQLIQALNA